MISKKIASAVGAGAVAGALGISLAGGAFTAGAATPSPTAPAAGATAKAHTGAHAHKGEHKGHRKGGELGRVEHGTGVVKTKTGFETISVDRGTVTAISPTAVSIKSADGTTETFVPVATSKYRVDGKPATLSAVKVGDKAGTVAVAKSGANDIRTLVVRPARAAKTTANA